MEVEYGKRERFERPDKVNFITPELLPHTHYISLTRGSGKIQLCYQLRQRTTSKGNEGTEGDIVCVWNLGNLPNSTIIHIINLVENMGKLQQAFDRIVIVMIIVNRTSFI